MYVRSDSARDDTELSPGINAGTRAQVLERIEHAVGEDLVVDESPNPTDGVDRRGTGQPGVGLGEHALGVGEPVELEMVGAEPVVEAVECVTQRGRRLVGAQPECGDAVERHARENAEGAHPEPRDLEQFGFVVGGALDDRSVGEHRRHCTNLCCEAGETRSGSVGSGGNRSGDGLDVDVAEVG